MTEAEAAEQGGGESTFTVIVAAVANLGIALAKAVAGVISGSSAMLSEAAHSVADTVTEVLLLTALKRSEKPADEDHPLGYGPERYIWAMLAAVATFVGGAVFSLYDGIHTLVEGEELGDPLVSYIVLGVAFLLEGYSLRTMLRRLPGPARLVNARGRVAASTDPRHLVGSLSKGPDFGRVLATGRPAQADGVRLMPCDGVPLVLVSAAQG